MGRKVLLTGGAGYIGSHTYLALVAAGYEVMIYDSFANAQEDVPARLELISGQPVEVQRGDIRDKSALDALFAEYRFEAVIHFAALKAVSESVADPLAYFDTNIGGLLTLLTAMRRAGVTRLVYSSSASVYQPTQSGTLDETALRASQNPYGYTKETGEGVLDQMQAADPAWAVGVLRYFNPAGAHPSGMIGEDPLDVPNNLMPYIAKVASGALPELTVFGDDYETRDGTGVRDYIHVEDLAQGHVLSLNSLFETGNGHVVNLGTGRGYSVLEMLAAYSKAVGRDLPYKIGSRRAGDVARLVANPERAAALLGFRATRDLEDMCASSWAWMENQRRKNVS